MSLHSGREGVAQRFQLHYKCCCAQNLSFKLKVINLEFHMEEYGVRVR